MSFFANDSWWPVSVKHRIPFTQITFWAKDKWLHLGGCFVLALVLSWWFGLTRGCELALLGGLLWEVKDVLKADGLSYRDLVWDAAGVLLAWGVWRLL
jgi:hypothetical protein